MGDNDNRQANYRQILFIEDFHIKFRIYIIIELKAKYNFLLLENPALSEECPYLLSCM